MTPSASAGKSVLQLFRGRYTMQSPNLNIRSYSLRFGIATITKLNYPDDHRGWNPKATLAHFLHS